jgi:pimeloyl-ACP methyl ester carboxylesterase
MEFETGTTHTSVGELAWSRAGSGRDLVLLHGTPFHSFVWLRIAAVLAHRFAVLTPDLLGYGESERALGVSLAQQGHAVRELLEQHGIASPIIVAHDIGAAAALRAHLLHGSDFDRLILFDPVLVRPWGTPFLQHVRAHEEVFAGLPAQAHGGLLDAYLQSSVNGSLRADWRTALGRPWRDAEGQRAFYRQIAQMDEGHTEELEPFWPEVRCSVFCAWGAEDTWLPSDHLGALAAGGLPLHRTRLLPEAGHLVQHDAPEAVLGFIEECLLDGGYAHVPIPGSKPGSPEPPRNAL